MFVFGDECGLASVRSLNFNCHNFAATLDLMQISVSGISRLLWKTGLSFSNVTRATFRMVRHKMKTRHLIEIAGFHLVAGARFELTTFRL